MTDTTLKILNKKKEDLIKWMLSQAEWKDQQALELRKSNVAELRTLVWEALQRREASTATAGVLTRSKTAVRRVFLRNLADDLHIS